MLKCEHVDYYPSIRPQVYHVCPAPLETVEEKLHEICDKVEEIHEAVEEGCSGNGNEEEEQGKRVGRSIMMVLQCFSDHDRWRIRLL